MGGSQSSCKSSSTNSRLFTRSSKQQHKITGHREQQPPLPPPRHASSRKVRPSDEEGDPDVDDKASAFIANFHKVHSFDLQNHA
ncbi:hypothetical protein Cni_G08531 [Canna indica]|uniref:Uncharacterized protein n=1 Tax=Canna indica TaxID=4628 RepID=A0AAQ3Q8S2_9LILI|nr:hypothetical protein Cni_G08531 [Canna indica]